MRHLFLFLIGLPLATSCMTQPSDDEDDSEDWSGLEGVWELKWDSNSLSFATSCDSITAQENIFYEPIHHIQINILFDDIVSVDVGEFPLEPPCDFDVPEDYIDACLDDNPYSTKMDGTLLFGSSFNASKAYGGMDANQYIQWELEIQGEVQMGQLNGDADLKIIEGNADSECRTHYKQDFEGRGQ